MYEWVASACGQALLRLNAMTPLTQSINKRHRNGASRKPVKWQLVASALLDKVITWFSTCTRSEVALVASNVVLYNVLPFKITLFCQPAVFCVLCYRSRDLDMSLFRAVAVAGLSRVIVNAGTICLECVCVCVIAIVGIGVTRSVLLPHQNTTVPRTKTLKSRLQKPLTGKSVTLKDFFDVPSAHVEDPGGDGSDQQISRKT